jgi:hypothetical protein
MERDTSGGASAEHPRVQTKARRRGEVGARMEDLDAVVVLSSNCQTPS